MPPRLGIALYMLKVVRAKSRISQSEVVRVERHLGGVSGLHVQSRLAKLSAFIDGSCRCCQHWRSGAVLTFVPY